MAEHLNIPGKRAVVVSELVEQLLLTLEVCSLTPVIDKITVNCNEKTKIKKKRPKIAH